ncbi:MAG: hypothetical protein AAGH92_03145 [Planctomycetota bacterium]
MADFEAFFDGSGHDVKDRTGTRIEAALDEPAEDIDLDVCARAIGRAGVETAGDGSAGRHIQLSIRIDLPENDGLILRQVDDRGKIRRVRLPDRRYGQTGTKKAGQQNTGANPYEHLKLLKVQRSNLPKLQMRKHNS